jgi:hypothetical protein
MSEMKEQRDHPLELLGKNLNSIHEITQTQSFET